MGEVCPDEEETGKDVPVDALVSDPPEAEGASVAPEIPLFPDQNPRFCLHGSLFCATPGPCSRVKHIIIAPVLRGHWCCLRRLVVPLFPVASPTEGFAAWFCFF